MRKYDFAFLVGRFQPVHEGHVRLIKHALGLADKVIILCGSHMATPTPKNPWTTEQRELMIRLALDGDESRVVVRGVEDSPYSDPKWEQRVQMAVSSIICNGVRRTPKVAMVGYHKDDSSYYLDKFRQWDYNECPPEGILSATDIRDDFLRTGALPDNGVLPKPVRNWLEDWAITSEFDYHNKYRISIDEYKALWKFSPFPPHFVTVDNVVVESGQLLLVQRGGKIGNSLFALPGGFLNHDEDILTASVRELKEETCLKVPTKVLHGSISDSKVYAHPERSLLGRVITHAQTIELPPCPVGGMTTVQGADDADKAFWLPLNQVFELRNRFHDDHYHIICDKLGI